MREEQKWLLIDGVDVPLDVSVKDRFVKNRPTFLLMIAFVFLGVVSIISISSSSGSKQDLKDRKAEVRKLKQANKSLEQQLIASRLETKECTQDVFVVWQAYVRRNELLVNILGGSRTVKEDIAYDNILLVADFKETEDCLGVKTYKDVFR